jgi:hypothetical protein
MAPIILPAVALVGLMLGRQAAQRPHLAEAIKRPASQTP